MDHSCHRCGASVPEGTPFCAQCGAPQIRVAAPSEEPPPLPTTSQPDLPPFRSVSDSRVNWGAALPRAIGAGILTAIFGMLSGNILLLVTIMTAGGIFAVWLYSMKADVSFISGGMGARIGAVTGFISSVCVAAITGLALAINRSEVLDQLKKGIMEQAARSPDPKAQQMMQNIVNSNETLAAILVLAGILAMFLFLIFGTVGGALGAIIARKK